MDALVEPAPFYPKMLSRIALSALALAASIPFTDALTYKRSDYVAACQSIEAALSADAKVSYPGVYRSHSTAH